MASSNFYNGWLWIERKLNSNKMKKPSELKISRFKKNSSSIGRSSEKMNVRSKGTLKGTRMRIRGATRSRPRSTNWRTNSRKPGLERREVWRDSTHWRSMKSIWPGSFTVCRMNITMWKSLGPGMRTSRSRIIVSMKIYGELNRRTKSSRWEWSDISRTKRTQTQL